MNKYCPHCGGEGWVCEDHPDVAWDEGKGCCGGAGLESPFLNNGNYAATQVRVALRKGTRNCSRSRLTSSKEKVTQ